MENNNILYEALPEEWNGYQLNTWFQVGIQIYLVHEDNTLADFEKSQIIIDLLFGDVVEDKNGEEKEIVRDYPQDSTEFNECIEWFLNGWSHDNSPKQKQKRKLMDYYKDQYRIYADFRQIYRINLNEADLHWWEFCGLLWNMPVKKSSFMCVIGYRVKKVNKNMSKEEKEATLEAQEIYSLEQPKQKKEYTKEEESKIDDYDRMMEDIAKKQAERKMIAEKFAKGV